MLAWTGFVAFRRSWIAARAFPTVFFSPNGKPTLLRDVNGPVDHVICATEMQSAEQLYFAKTFVYGYRYGLGSPGDLMLHDAVQASACLPGAFPARWLRTSRHGFRYAADEAHPDDPCPDPEDRPPKRPAFMVLTDGGVYDNMGDQWALGFRDRRACWPDLETTHSEPHDLVVVNSSAGLGWSELKRSIVPGIGELLTLLKVKDVLYDQTTATRRRLLGDRSRRALAGTEGMRVGLINIPQSPFDVAAAFAVGHGLRRSAVWRSRKRSATHPRAGRRMRERTRRSRRRCRRWGWTCLPDSYTTPTCWRCRTSTSCSTIRCFRCRTANGLWTW